MARRSKTRLLITAAVALCTALSAAEQAPTTNDRLISVGKLWATVLYFHPYLAYKDLDWDKALVDALPAIRSATDSHAYAVAVNSMLAELHDPLTRAYGEGEQQRLEAAEKGPQRSWIHYGLPAFQNGWSGFYSAFLVRNDALPATVMVPLGMNVTAAIRIAEIMGEKAVSAPVNRPDRLYAENAYPPIELRVLAAYKLWGAVHYFFAYKDLMDGDWDTIFGRSLPAFMAAKDAREYNLAVAETVRYLADSHAVVKSPEMDRYFGEVPVGLRLRLIDKKPVITEVLDPVARKAGIKPGDVLTKVDGEDIVSRVRREAGYLSASTQQNLGTLVCDRLLNGPNGSSASITVTNAAGPQKDFSLQRDPSYRASLAMQRTGESVRMLSGNIGYADLNRLNAGDVDAALEKLRNTKAIIFDVRGDRCSVADLIAPRLTEKRNVADAIVTGPLLLQPDVPTPGIESSTASYFSIRTLPNSESWKYNGKTVMLIDERTSGQAERAGLSFEAANRTEFIGTTSAGVIGETTDFAIPGGIIISFTGQDVRHANGGPLQRLGLQPSLTAAATIEGIRAGTDQVLQAALRYLASK